MRLATARRARVNTQPPDALPAGQKRPRGAYYTDDALALAVCRSLRTAAIGIGQPRDILEPGCGGGAFLRAARATWPGAGLYGVDLVPACKGPGRVWAGDLFAVRDKFDLVLGNPDFDIAVEVVRHCMTILRDGGTLALALRLSFWETPSRAALFMDHPLRAFQPVAQRQSFTGDGGSDKLGLGVFVWQQGHRGRGEILPPVVWR